MGAPIVDTLDFSSIIVDVLDFPLSDAVNNAAVTTGTVPLTIGSTETFKGKARLGGLPWDLTGGQATLLITDPTGNQISITGTVTGGVPAANWTVVGPAGANWVRAWKLQDAAGIIQYSLPLIFSVVSSPS